MYIGDAPRASAVVTRIAVDIGGTFTDLVTYDSASGESVQGKVLTVPDAPEQGVVAALTAHLPAELIRRAEYFLHGTTVGLNALLERRGVTVGLLTTKAFRDVLEIRRGDRDEMYNLFWKQPAPLVPRRLRLEVPGRILASGEKEGSLTQESVADALAVFNAHGINAIAVALINAYVDPAHELEVEQMLRSAGFTGGITLSHRVSGEYREYERTCTAVIDAFVRGRMANYLDRLQAQLSELGFQGQCLITRSGGGTLSFSEAQGRPFETIMSGPVGGAEGASELARRLGDEQIVTADVGGTSFDTALIVNGKPQLLFEGRIDGMPIQSDWVDVRSIGAGGGCICSCVWWGTHPDTGATWMDGAPHPVGQGAWEGGDGGTMLHIAESATRFTPIEVWETRNPWVVEQMALAQDSGGPGQWRGGAGIDFRFRMLSDTYATTVFERSEFPPWGLAGGGDTKSNCAELVIEGKARLDVSKATGVFIPKGERLEFHTGGGGGYGPPEQRDPDAVKRDLADEYISDDFARQHYPQAF